MNNKITIFLDHDGVICTDKEWGKRQDLGTKFDPLNSMAIARLNSTLSDFDCEIVCSSDWRLHDTLEGMQKLYEINGIKAPLVGYTEVFDAQRFGERPTEIRVREIMSYVKKNNIEKWLVIDDMYMRLNTKNFYRTSLYDGLTQSDTKKVREKLRSL